MVRAWQALDRAASEAGCAQLEKEVWEVGLEDGTVAALVRTGAEAHEVVREGRAMKVYTMAEIGRLLDAFPEIIKAKDVFPGSIVTAVREPLPELPADGDELPEIMAG